MFAISLLIGSFGQLMVNDDPSGDGIIIGELVFPQGRDPPGSFWTRFNSKRNNSSSARLSFPFFLLFWLLGRVVIFIFIFLSLPSLSPDSSLQPSSSGVLFLHFFSFCVPFSFSYLFFFLVSTSSSYLRIFVYFVCLARLSRPTGIL